MQTTTKRTYYSAFAIALGIWFCLTSWLWVYFMNFIISFPVAIVGLFLWNRGKKLNEHRTLNKTALYIYILGAVLSSASLIMLLIEN